MTKVISLSQALALLSAQLGYAPDDMRIALEEENPAKPYGPATWCLRPDGSIRREDGKFFAIELETEGYPRPVVHEEPLATAPDDGTPKRIGAVVVCQRADGRIKIERRGSLTDPTLRLRLPRASNSNPDQPPPGEHRGWLEANNERIRAGIHSGQIEVRYATLEFPDTEAMSLEGFRAVCVDGLSRAALDVVFGS